jgi:GT2 family glycosyltransferase
MADYDFGLRLRAAGGQVILAPGYVGECATNSLIGRSEMAGLSLREHWRRLTSVKEQPPAERAAFYRRHAGRLWMVFFALPYLHSPIMILKRFIARYILSGRIK